MLLLLLSWSSLPREAKREASPYPLISCHSHNCVVYVTLNFPAFCCRVSFFFTHGEHAANPFVSRGDAHLTCRSSQQIDECVLFSFLLEQETIAIHLLGKKCSRNSVPQTTRAQGKAEKVSRNKCRHTRCLLMVFGQFLIEHFSRPFLSLSYLRENAFFSPHSPCTFLF